MEKLKITEADLVAGQPVTLATTSVDTGAAPTLPLKQRLALLPLVLVLPVLCLAVIAIRPSLADKAALQREALLQYLLTLLAASGLLYCVAGGVWISKMRRDPPGKRTDQLDTAARTLTKLENLPAFTGQAMDRAQLELLLPALAFVVGPSGAGPAEQLADLPATKVGVAAILHVDATNCLAVTCKHLVDPSRPPFLYTANGYAPAELVAQHTTHDLALLQLKLRDQPKPFVQPLRPVVAVPAGGEGGVVLGHPQGKFFKMLDATVTAPVEAGQLRTSLQLVDGLSGAPFYDFKGNLLGLATSRTPGQLLPATTLLDAGGWQFESGKRRLLDTYLAMPGVRATGANP